MENENKENLAAGSPEQRKPIQITPSNEFVNYMKEQDQAAAASQPSNVPDSSTTDAMSSVNNSQTPNVNQIPYQQNAVTSGSIYPGPSANSSKVYKAPEKINTGLFGSVPNGVVVIVVLTVISALFNFLFASSASGGTNNFLLFGLCVSVLLAIWLLYMSSIARTIFIILSTLAIFGNLMSLFRTIDVQRAYTAQSQAIDYKLDQLNSKKTLTTQDKQDLARYEKLKERYSTLQPSDFTKAYMTFAFGVVYSSGVVIYLLRPSIKERFE